jgi:hypothetical protein
MFGKLWLLAFDELEELRGIVEYLSTHASETPSAND